MLSLKRFDFLTRDQLQRLHRLGELRNTNRVLVRLSDYLSCFREGYQSVYYLNKLGRDYVGSEKVMKRTANYMHTVMRNEFWLFSGCPTEWKNEVKLSDGDSTVIADSFYKKSIQWNCLEVDLERHMKDNRSKIERYTKLYKNGLIAKKLGHFPTLIWLTKSELRKKQLKELCKELPCIVYTLSDIK